jgi:hypothetical protein
MDMWRIILEIGRENPSTAGNHFTDETRTALDVLDITIQIKWCTAAHLLIPVPFLLEFK